MNEIKLNQLFCTPLMSFKYGKITNDENQFILKCLENTQDSVYNLRSKENYILDTGLFNLKKFFESSIKTYVETVVIGEEYDDLELDFKITQSWLNKTLCNSNGHHLHNHPNSFISGVFYIQVDPSVDSIVFNKSSQDFFHLPIKSYNNFNSSSWKVPVTNGELLLFPSSLFHQVNPVGGKKDRISLSFNTFPYGLLGHKDGLTELRI
tara:strand:+ start:48 stop:671 length:624 start_codon:yes stop_codon:yes gene_type:complete